MRMLARRLWLSLLIVAVSAALVTATAEAPLAVFSPLQALLPLGPHGEPEALDGKVIALSERDDLRTFLVRFTGVSWARQDAIDSLARGGQPLPNPASL